MTRWGGRGDVPRGNAYDARFAELAEAGHHVHGEADLVASLVEGRRIVDAGCGTGRVGIELAARLRERQPHLPVLVATGQWDPTVRRAVEAAGHQVLRKPYTSTQVVEAAARVRAVVDLTEPAAADGEHPPGGIAAR